MPAPIGTRLRHLAVFVAITTILLLAPQGVLAGPGPQPTPPTVDPSNGLLPDQASDRAIEKIGEKVVSQGGRYHNIDDALVPPALSPMAAAVPTSGDYRIDALLTGYKWTVPTITYSFYSDAVFNGSYYGTETGVTEVSDGVKANVRQIMAWYGTLLNVNLVEVPETPTSIGLIRVLRATGTGYAYAYYPIGTSMFSLAGDVILDPTYDRLGDTNGFQHPAGTHGYTTLIHEIGHALGLKHPFDASPNLPPTEDNDSFTVMTYSNYGSAPATPMTYDLMALQFLYGARPKNTGSDTYLFTSRGADQYTIGSQLFQSTPYAIKQTIWDSTGSDTLDFSSLPFNASGYRLDLKGGGWLTSRADYYSGATAIDFIKGTSLAASTSIGSVVNSGSSDTIYANPSTNLFKGYSQGRVTGQDVIYDADSADTLDLSGYSSGGVTQTQSANDLVLGLGANGSVTLKDYYLGKQPRVSFSDLPPANTAPAAVASANPTSGTSPLVVAFDGSGSMDPDGTIVSYSWNFGDGATASGAAATHTYTTAGGYTATLTVTDNAGATGSTTTAISVQPPANLAPRAVANASPSTGVAPLAVSFDGSGSSDPDGTIVSYAWNFGDGGTGTGASVLHSYSNPGSYTAVLTVTDNAGATATAQVAITAQLAQAKVARIGAMSITLVAAGRNGKAGQVIVTVTDQGGAPIPGATVTGRWSGVASGNSSGTTGADGRLTLASKSISKAGTLSFAISGVTPPAGYTYAADQNNVSSVSIAVTK